MGELERLDHILGKSMGRKRRVIQRELPRVPKPLRGPEPSCARCKGAGYLRRDVPYGHPLFGKPVLCQCQQRLQVHALFADAHIPPLYENCTFASYQNLTIMEAQRQIAGQVQAFVLLRLGEYQGRKRGLYLYGSFGTGKSGLAIAALREVMAAGKSALYLPTYELFQMLRDGIAASQRLSRGYGDKEDQKEERAGSKLQALVQTVEWLVLDDLGVECRSDWVIGQLYALLEGRRCEGRYTIFTSNKDAHALAHQWYGGEATFEDTLRITERIGEYCVPLSLFGRNLREDG